MFGCCPVRPCPFPDVVRRWIVDDSCCQFEYFGRQLFSGAVCSHDRLSRNAVFRLVI